jgi:hypothetical protein
MIQLYSKNDLIIFNRQVVLKQKHKTKQRKWRGDIKDSLQQHGLIMVKDHNMQKQ